VTLLGFGIPGELEVDPAYHLMHSLLHRMSGVIRVVDSYVNMWNWMKDRKETKS